MMHSILNSITTYICSVRYSKFRRFSFKSIFCILCFFILFTYWSNWTPPKCSIAFSKEHELNELERWHTGCPSIGGGPLGVILTAQLSENLSNNIWAYLSVLSLAKKYDILPAIPRVFIDTLHHAGFTSIRVTSLEDLLNRCSLNHLIKEHKKAEINQENILKAMEYGENKNVTFIILQTMFIAEKEYLMYYWLQFNNMLKFKEELLSYSSKTIESGMRNQMISSGLSGSIQYVGVLVTAADDDGNLVEFYLRAMTEMRHRLRPRGVVFVVVGDDPEWCRRYLKDSDVIVTDHESPERDLSLLAACNHTIITATVTGLTAAVFNTEGMTIVRESTSKSEQTTCVMYLAKNLPNWTIMN